MFNYKIRYFKDIIEIKNKKMIFYVYITVTGYQLKITYIAVKCSRDFYVHFDI